MFIPHTVQAAQSARLADFQGGGDQDNRPRAHLPSWAAAAASRSDQPTAFGSAVIASELSSRRLPELAQLATKSHELSQEGYQVLDAVSQPSSQAKDTGLKINGVGILRLGKSKHFDRTVLAVLSYSRHGRLSLPTSKLIEKLGKAQLGSDRERDGSDGNERP